MCKYCKDSNNGTELINEKIGSIGDDDILLFATQWGGEIDFGINIGTPLADVTIKFKYCPMCGKKIEA